MDLIYALATPPGRGGLAVIRLSGEGAEGLLKRLFTPAGLSHSFEHRYLMFGQFLFAGKAIDEGMAVLMRAPNSYTKEDVAELHLHGSPELVRQISLALESLGARPAEPGEFTRRAFLNGRIDLSRAEAVMELVASVSERAAGAALRQLQGGTLRFVETAQEELIRALAGLSAAIDYPEEIDEIEASHGLKEALQGLSGRLERACDQKKAALLREGLSVALVGKPNVGKSSLLNALLMEERAIVTDIPGTTRDLVSGKIDLDGILISLWDTAGLRESGEVVERLGIDKTRQAILGADLCLFVLDAALAPDDEDLAAIDSLKGRDYIVVLNKTDKLTNPEVGKWVKMHAGEAESLAVSALNGEGMEALKQAISDRVLDAEDVVLTQQRQIRLASQALSSVKSALEGIERQEQADLIFVDLQDALHSLSRITGQNVDDQLLDEVFSQFCVGK